MKGQNVWCLYLLAFFTSTVTHSIFLQKRWWLTGFETRGFSALLFLDHDVLFCSSGFLLTLLPDRIWCNFRASKSVARYSWTKWNWQISWFFRLLNCEKVGRYFSLHVGTWTLPESLFFFPVVWMKLPVLQRKETIFERADFTLQLLMFVTAEKENVLL